MNGVSIIIPFLNEEENVQNLCETLDNYAQGIDFPLEFVFVDDGSSDRSSELIARFPFKNKQVSLLKLSKNCGSHAAIRAGILHASQDLCMFFSADLQEPVSMIKQAYDKLQEGYDAVYIQKGATQTSAFEKWFSRHYARSVQRFVSKDFPLGGVNNILFNKKIKDELNRNIEANSSIFLHIMTMGFKSASLTVDYLERKKGQSKWTFSKKVKMYIDSFVAFSYAPIRMITMMGLIFFMLGALLSFLLVLSKVFGLFHFDAGYPTIVSVLLLGFGLTNMSLGVIAEYLWRTLDAARNRPLFIVSDVIKIKQEPGI